MRPGVVGLRTPVQPLRLGAGEAGSPPHDLHVASPLTRGWRLKGAGGENSPGAPLPGRLAELCSRQAAYLGEAQQR